MAYHIAGINLKKILNSIDWKLLLFLSLFLNVKLAVKIPVIIIIYLLQPDFRFGFNLKNPRLPLFYPLIIVIAFAGLVINKNFGNPHYLELFFAGIFFWGLCILAAHQVKLFVENNDTEVIQKTILVFFVINAAFSFFNIATIIGETGAVNPYLYQGQYQKYFIGTGDYIRGLTFDTSTTNAVLNAFGVIYFFSLKKPAMMIVCMAVMLLTGSNFTNLVLALTLALLFVFKSDKDQKSLAVVCFMLLVIFMAKISPQNDGYVLGSIKNLVYTPKQQAAIFAASPVQKTSAGSEEIKRKIARRYIDSIRSLLNKKQPAAPPTPATPVLPNYNGRLLIAGPDINTPPYQTPTDTTFEERRLLAFIDAHKNSLPVSGDTVFRQALPGKVTCLLQTVKFLRHHPAKIIAGDGIGNFSSKLAFKATGLGMEGGYPQRLIYISKDFLSNHFDVYLNFFSKRSGLHSLTNSPDSVYDQMLAEYGLAGVMVFVIFYIGFFIGQYKKLTYGAPLLLAMAAFFLIGYWFEQLSVVVFFELLMFLDIRENNQPKPVNYGLE